MRIGEFAKKNDLNVDTIRYYIELNLIHPIRKGKYFYFEDEQQIQLDRLLYLKDLNFSLMEIKQIMSVEKFNKIEIAKHSKLYKNLLLDKKKYIEDEIQNLKITLGKLDQEINNLGESYSLEAISHGLRFNDLSYLTCPRCFKPIELKDGSLKNNRIYSGKGICGCGYTLSIDEGIIITPSMIDSSKQLFEDEEKIIDNFIDETPKTFLDTMLKYTEEVTRVLVEKDLSDKTLLFMRTNVGPVEVTLLSKSADIKRIILVEEDLHALKVAKKSIETNFPDSHVLYVCGRLVDLPIQKNSVDIAIDFLATFTNGFDHNDNLYKVINPFLKEKCSVIGLYLYFKKSDMFARLEKSKYKLFDIRAITHNIQSLHFNLKQDYDEIIMEEGTNVNDFFKPGDTVHSKIMIFERNTK